MNFNITQFLHRNDFLVDNLNSKVSDNFINLEILKIKNGFTRGLVCGMFCRNLHSKNPKWTRKFRDLENFREM